MSHPAQDFLQCTLHIIYVSSMSIHNLDIFFSQFWTRDVWNSLILCCCCLVTKPWTTLSDPMNYSSPGSSVHWISQGRILERLILGARTGVPTHDKVMQERPDGQGKSGLEGPPGPARASTPKPESVCYTILRLSPTPLILTGGYPWPPFSEGNQLRTLVNKPPGHNKSVSIQTTQMAL